MYTMRLLARSPFRNATMFYLIAGQNLMALHALFEKAGVGFVFFQAGQQRWNCRTNGEMQSITLVYLQTYLEI